MSTIGQDILALVRIPSVTGHESALADALEVRLRGRATAQGNDLIRRDDTLLLVPRGRSLEAGAKEANPSRPLVVLAGHLDTVPLGDTPEPELAHGRIAGRGACDMKAGVAVMLNLAENLPSEAGFADRAFIFYTGEEGSGTGNSLRLILESEEWLKRAGLAILLEPTKGDLELGCNGSIHICVNFRGRACHSARPWMGTHPIQAALPWLAEMLDRPVRVATVAGVTFKEVATLTTLRAGDARNVVPATMCVNLNFRYPPDRTPAEAEELAYRLCPEGVEVSVLDHSPAARIDAEAPLYRYLCESTGLPRRGKQGWTDVARFTSHGIPALNWGPGNPELAHTKEESVEVEEAETCLARMERFFLSPGPG